MDEITNELLTHVDQIIISGARKEAKRIITLSDEFIKREILSHARNGNYNVFCMSLEKAKAILIVKRGIKLTTTDFFNSSMWFDIMEQQEIDAEEWEEFEDVIKNKNVK